MSEEKINEIKDVPESQRTSLETLPPENQEAWKKAVRVLMDEHEAFNREKVTVKDQEGLEENTEEDPFLFSADEIAAMVESYNATAPEKEAKIESESTLVEKATDVLRRAILLEMRKSARKDRDLQTEISFLENRALAILTQESKRQLNPNNSPDRSTFEQISNLCQYLEAKRQELLRSNPDAYYTINALDFRQSILRARRGEMIETPYVKASKDHLRRNMAKGQPQFIHGELGGGKTEICRQTAREFLIDRQVQKDIAKPEVEAELRQGLDPKNPEARKEYIKRYVTKMNALKFEYGQALRSGSPDAVAQFEPYFVSGSKDMMTQDLFAEKSLKLDKINGRTIQEHNEAMEKEYEKAVQGKGDLTEAEKTAIRQQIMEAYRLKNSAFGTVVETIEKEITKAMREGKPVILDEINLIPAPVLASLNDVLQRRAGDLVYALGVDEKIRITEGFSVIMTGNLSNDKVDYVGTNKLNPAFLSRLDSYRYEYLPQSTDGVLGEQAHPERNELFYAIMANMVDAQGAFVAPEAKQSLDKIFKLTQLARVTQDIFSGQWQDTTVNQTVSGDSLEEPELTTAVLSMRNLLRVLNDWEGGLEKDIDKALWDGFIAGITDVKDQQLVILQAQSRYGFFTGAGYRTITNDPYRQALIRFEDLRTEPYHYERPAKGIVTPREMVELLYGSGPERTVFPELDMAELGLEAEVVSSPEEIGELMQKIADARLFSAELDKLKQTICPLVGEVEV